MCDTCEPRIASSQQQNVDEASSFSDNLDNTQFSDFDDPSFEPKVGSPKDFIADVDDLLLYYIDSDYDIPSNSVFVTN